MSRPVGIAAARGSKSHLWKDDRAGKLALHIRVSNLRGKASIHPCLGISDRCTGRGAEWARIHDQTGLDPYRDYVPLCHTCHFNYDRPHSSNFGAKLTTHSVRLIRELIALGGTDREISECAGVTVTCIRNIRTGKSWRGV